jgi:hypothetical protein
MQKTVSTMAQPAFAQGLTKSSTSETIDISKKTGAKYTEVAPARSYTTFLLEGGVEALTQKM